MFGSVAARKELHICLQCEYWLLGASRLHLASSTRTTRRFTTKPSSDESSDLSNDVRATSNSTKPGRGYDSRRNLRADNTRSSSESSLLRLSTPNEDLNHSLHGRGRFRRHDMRDVNNSQLQEEVQNKLKIVRYPVDQERQDELDDAPQGEPRYPAFRHPDVTSDRVELGVNRLGEPATIRVIPEIIDRGRRKRDELSSRVIDEEQLKIEKRQEQQQHPALASSDDLVNGLDLEKEGAAGAAESMNNIETLRRAFLDSLNQFEGATQAECHKLASSLERGFTTDQLRRYKRFAISMNSTGLDRLDTLSINERYRISRWYAGPSQWPGQALRRLDPKTIPHEKESYAVLSSGLDSMNMPKMNSKQRLINSILRACWAIRPREEKLQEGSVSMKIDKEWLDLLLSQEEQVFYMVSEMFKVKTEIAEDYSLVKVTGFYDACVDAIRVIANTVSSGEIERIDLLDTISGKIATNVQKTHLQDLVARPEFWHEIEDQTLTMIKPVNPATNGSYTKIDVYHLPTQTKGLTGVKRRVIQLQKLLDSDSAAWTSFPPPRSTLPSLVPIANPPDMTLTERHMDWYRWRDVRLPEQRHADMSSICGDGDTIFDKLAEIWTSHRKSKTRDVYKEAIHHEHWTSTAQTSMTAILGQLVYAVPDNKLLGLQKRTALNKYKESKNDTPPQRWDDLATDLSRNRRTFIPTTPHLLTLLHASVQEESTLSNFFRITLAPKKVSQKASAKGEQAPKLELDVDIDEAKKKTKLQSARLILNRQHVDLALPRQILDLRFTTEISIAGSTANFDPTILTFLQESNLDVWGTGQFETPSVLSLSLPRRICQLVGDDRTLSTTKSKKSNSLASEAVTSTLQSKVKHVTALMHQRNTTTESDRLRASPGKQDPSASQINDPIPNMDVRQVGEDDLINASIGEKKIAGSAAIVSLEADQDLQTISSGEPHEERSTDIVDHEGVAILSESDDYDDTGRKSTAVSKTSNKCSKGNVAEDDAENVGVEYIFESLAIHSKLQSLYQGFPLSMSTIEGGQTGGKREEVKLEIAGIADDLICCTVDEEKRLGKKEEVAKSYFMTFFGAISELIGRLPR